VRCRESGIDVGRCGAKIVDYRGDGSWTEYSVYLPADFPDALDEAHAQTLKLYQEATAYDIALANAQADDE